MSLAETLNRWRRLNADMMMKDEQKCLEGMHSKAHVVIRILREKYGFYAGEIRFCLETLNDCLANYERERGTDTPPLKDSRDDIPF